MTAATSHADRGLRGRRTAFSILELLIVIGIIAVLFALLFPSIARARARAKSAVCASNLRQLYVAGQSWKAESDRVGDTSKLFQAYGWMEEWAPYAGNDRRIYNCPDDPSLQFLAGDSRTGGDAYRGGDKAAGTGAAPAAAPGSSGSSPSGSTPATQPASNSSPIGDISDLVLRDIPDYNNPGKYYDMAFKEGPWVKKKNVTDNSYELWAEHHFWDPAYLNNGRADWEDVAIKVTTNPDGTVTATLLDRVQGNGHTSFRDDVYVKQPDGTLKKVFNNVYGVDPKDTSSPSGTTTKLTDTSNGTSAPTGGSSGGGAGGGSGSTGGGIAGAAATPGAGANASYGFNTNLRHVNGDPQKVMANDYYLSVIDPVKEDWSTLATDRNGKLFFARHMGFVNVLYADGSVRPVVPTKTNLNPAFGDNRAQFWEK